jgi:hypothetical protein
MSLEPIVIAAAIAVVGLVVLAVKVRNRPSGPTPRSTAAKPGALDGARDVIDQSIGMYALRRLTGRPTSPSADVIPPERGPAAASVPSANEVPIARTAAIPAEGDATGERPVFARTSRAAVSFYETEPSRPAPVATSVRPPIRTPPIRTLSRAAVTNVPPRERLVRDTGLALVGLAVLGLAAVTLWPHGSNGPPVQGLPGVIHASGPLTTSTTLAGATSASASGASPSGVVLSETGRPSRAPTVSPGVTPSGTHRTAGTPRPTTKPTATLPGSTASPIPSPTPGLTPSPEPSVTPIPTSEPTPSPTPEPTPTPTPTPTAS